MNPRFYRDNVIQQCVLIDVLKGPCVCLVFALFLKSILFFKERPWFTCPKTTTKLCHPKCVSALATCKKGPTEDDTSEGKKISVTHIRAYTINLVEV